MKISLWKKISVCTLAGFMCLYAVYTDVAHRLPSWFSEKALTALAFSSLFICLLFIIIWQLLERKNKVDSMHCLAFWQGVIIYGEVLIFLRFGFLKLFHLHMNASLISDDFPAGALSGCHLMDYFFSRAPEFKILIGCLQITGASALLFRRTRLLGIFILMPIIVNIVCMDFFFDVGEGITITAVFLTLGLIYLLFQEKQMLIQVFFKTKSAMPVLSFKSAWRKNLLRIAPVLVTLMILIPSIHPIKNASLMGKYKVEKMNINGKDVLTDLNNDSLLAAIYFDENETCLLRYNNYRNVKIGKAIYNDKSGKLNVIWRFPKNTRDTSFWNVLRFANSDDLILSGQTGTEHMKATLTKTELAKVLFK